MAGKITIVGIEDASYTSKKDSKQVQAVRLHVTEDVGDSVQGLRAYNVFISGGKPSDFKIAPCQYLLYRPGFNNSAQCYGVVY